MTISYLLFMGIGRLMIYLGMKFPLFSESRYEFVRRLFECDECLGVWVYTILSGVMGVVLFKDMFYVPFASELVTGGITSFIMHLLSLGWSQKFGVIIIE
jgi:hypothetical protein